MRVPQWHDDIHIALLPAWSSTPACRTHVFCWELINLLKYLLLALWVGGEQVRGEGQCASGGLVPSDQEEESLACYLILC